ncbi:cytochrome P450 [Nocardia brasiliensis]|uniref:cytochrome P450 n=1 Tax=Nocardia brasiliensis TaxID=37326 RepID=UPI0033FF93F4
MRAVFSQHRELPDGGLESQAIPTVPGALPMVGHSLALLRDPLAFISALPAYGDVTTIRIGSLPMVLVCDPLLTRQVLLEDSTYDKGGPVMDKAAEVIGDGLITCPHSRHRRQRRLCQPAFHPDLLPEFGAVFASAAKDIASSWHDDQIVDVDRELMAMTAGTAVLTMFANTLPETSEQIIADLVTVVEGAFRRMITPRFLNHFALLGNRRFDQANKRLRSAVADAVGRRRADDNHHSDLLAFLQEAVDATEHPDSGDRLTDIELVDQITTFFGAGTETTASTVAWALHLLACHPEIQDRLHQEIQDVLAGEPMTFERLTDMEMASNVITETLRLYPPAWLLTRTAAKETSLGGFRIRAGTTLAYSPYIIHRRPDLYDDPDRFDPQRWRNTKPDRAAFIPFAAGARKCIGDRVAVTQATMALIAIVGQWRLTPLPGQSLEPAVKATLTPRNLRLRVVARRSL